MIVLFNCNEYLGGGETLLLRFGRYISKNMSVGIITSKNSYISNNIDFNCELLEVEKYDYYYMHKNEKVDYLNHLKTFLSQFDDLKLVTFCFRDLYTLIDLSMDIRFTPFHLLLHPLDHLYVGQSLFDKIKQKISDKQKFSKKNILKLNKNIINNLNENGLLISMNANISKRVHVDYSIKIQHTIALPVFEDSLKVEIKKCNNKNILWIGRLVDFKLPAIFAMIDFLNKNSEYTFNIIGYGAEEKVQAYILHKKNDKLMDQVKFLGKVEHKDLKEKIKEFDIGYAMGTSIVELSSVGLPTIVATASPNFEVFNDELCSGMCYELGYGDLGDDMYNPEVSIEKLGKISDCIKKIEENYENESQLSFDKTKEVFSINKNIEQYQILFMNTISKQNIFNDISIPNADFLKKIVVKVKE